VLDYVILGAGVSGVAFGRLLQLSGVARFVILEADTTAGGLCRSAEVRGHVFDTGGGHFLNSKYPRVYGFLFRHLGRHAFNLFDRVSEIQIDGHRVDYPLESNIWQLPASLAEHYLASIQANGEARGLPAPTDFEAWVRWKLGDLIAERYMLPYNRKVWGVEPADMDIDWLHKIPRLDVAAITRACATRTSNTAYFPSHQQFYYPKQGGFQTLFDALLEPVRSHVVLGEPAHRVEQAGESLLVNGRYRARRVINTVPWHALAESPIFDSATRQAIARLKASHLVVSLHEGVTEARTHWVYEPDDRLAHHRTFFPRNYAPHSAATGLTRETNGRRFVADSTALAVSHNPYAYPVPALGWANFIATVLARVEPLGLHGLGRWGQWQYFNSDVCIHEAMQLAARLGHVGWEPAAAPLDS